MSQDPLDGMVSEFAHIHINTPTIQVIDSQLTYDDPRVTRLLQRELDAARTNVLITADYSISTRATAYCEKWDIPRKAAENFMTLASGNPRFPTILLQNPSDNHDQESFRDMVDNCWTLSWLEKVLHAFRLTVNDVIILDICPLLSKQWMEDHSQSQSGVSEAIGEAYKLMELVLDRLKPKILISCQCQTNKSRTQMGDHATGLARELASSESAANQKRVVRLQYRAHDFYVVQGFHPRHFLGRPDAKAPEREKTLRALLRHFFEPCGRRMPGKPLLQLERDISNLASVMKAPYGQAPHGQALYGQAPHGQAPYGQVPRGQVPHGQAPYGQVPHGQTPYGQAPHGQVPYGQAPHGQALYGQAPHGQVPYWQAPHGQVPYGQAPHGQVPYGQAPHGQVPYGQAPHGQAPYGQALHGYILHKY